MNAAFAAAQPIREVAVAGSRALPDSVLESTEPVVLRGVVSDWPSVRAARESTTSATAYLRRFYAGMPVTVLSAPAEQRGRLFYNDDLTGFNFKRGKAPLDWVFDELERAAQHPDPPSLYVGSTLVDQCLPGFRAENDCDLAARHPYVSIWLGNRTRIAAHYDLPTNLACVVAGRRRFTLFPPEQLANLYVGPLEFTPAGQAVSLVDFADPDLVRFPKFAQALQHARIAELAAGDALLIPSLWWHHIEALESFNVLVNYWWRRGESHPETPFSALLLTMMAIRDLPPEQRAAWEGIFRHYVFSADSATAAHIPSAARGALGDIDAESARALRAALIAQLTRSQG